MNPAKPRLELPLKCGSLLEKFVPNLCGDTGLKPQTNNLGEHPGKNYFTRVSKSSEITLISAIHKMGLFAWFGLESFVQPSG